MKDFLKMTLAVVFGFIIMTILGIIICTGLIGSAFSSASPAPSSPGEGVLKIDLSKFTLAEQSRELDPFSSIQGESGPTVGIWDAVQAINAAALDPAVKFIYLKPDGSSAGLATLSELRMALRNFREASGKAIVSYSESPTTAGYWLASAADKVYTTSHPGGGTGIVGIGSQLFFLGDLLREFGVNVQVIRHGKYKSYGEMYTRNSASPENREQYQVMISSVWATISSDIASSRGITVTALNEAIDNLELCLPQDLVDAGLADETMDRSALEDKLTALAVKEKFKDVKFISFPDYVNAKKDVSKSKQKIAVIYAQGDIVMENDPDNVGGDRFASVIEKVRRDDNIKAVVLRVNSPGGSVLASEKIKQQLDLLGEEKPLIASYGDYAASGGYWISANCNKIFSDAVTLTGSIGVFGIVPDLSRTIKEKLHIGVETVNSNKHTDMQSLTRPLDEDEYAYMLRSIEDIYDRFTTIVSQGRGIPKEQVDEIGQGRVWTGTDALGLGLVDEIGTLEDAVHYACVAAGDAELSNWKIKSYPTPRSNMEQVMEKINGTDTDYSVMVKELRNLKSMKALARLPYEVKFY